MTLKIGSRSPKSNQLFTPSKLCIYAKLVKICPLVQKITHGNEISYNTKGRCDLENWVKVMSIQNLVSFCEFVLKLLSKNQILTLIKGHNSVANLRKTTIYNTDVDLVNDNVYTKFGLILSIRSQNIE